MQYCSAKTAQKWSPRRREGKQDREPLFCTTLAKQVAVSARPTVGLDLKMRSTARGNLPRLLGRFSQLDCSAAYGSIALQSVRRVASRSCPLMFQLLFSS